jgi:uncharacterized protein YukE
MSMDEQFEQMQYFAQALNTFNDRLKSSMIDLSSKHAFVDPLWQDAFRKRYDAEWDAFKTSMELYIAREAPAYTEFLQQKLIALRNYLYGEY